LQFGDGERSGKFATYGPPALFRAFTMDDARLWSTRQTVKGLGWLNGHNGSNWEGLLQPEPCAARGKILNFSEQPEIVALSRVCLTQGRLADEVADAGSAIYSQSFARLRLLLRVQLRHENLAQGGTWEECLFNRRPQFGHCQNPVPAD
jgi:hypothetical protein